MELDYRKSDLTFDASAAGHTRPAHTRGGLCHERKAATKSFYCPHTVRLLHRLQHSFRPIRAPRACCRAGRLGRTDLDIAIARTFLEIVKTGSFVSAANSLNLTQTAISARIRVLEAQLERPVFVRRKSGVLLTPAGEQFQRFATSIVQMWDRARRSVALPPGRERVVTIGVETSLWTPLLGHWLLWMRRECPELAIHAQIGAPERLLEEVQDGTLDTAVLYAPAQRQGVIAELLFEERLVLIKSLEPAGDTEAEGRVYVDWGGVFAASHQAAFPDLPNPALSVSYGPLALDYILKVGGSGYFRMSVARPFINTGQVELVPNSPEFPYCAYAVHSAGADPVLIERIRTGLRAAASADV